MTQNSFNMERFRHSIYLDAPIEEVYKMAATGDGITKWFIGKADYSDQEGKARTGDEFAITNDTYIWQWLAKDLSVSGKIIETKPNAFFKFTFGSTFIVTITLKEDNNRTLLTLEQEYSTGAEHNDFAHINCCSCWVFFLANLKSVIEHGFDLRETLIDNEELINR